MGIDNVSGVSAKQPLLPSKEIVKNDLKAGLSRLIQAPSLEKLWVDKTGRIHKLVTVSGLFTLLKFLVAKVKQALSEMDYSQFDKAQSLIAATQNLIDLYAQTVGASGTTLAQLNELRKDLRTIEKKLSAKSNDFLPQKKKLLDLTKELSSIEYFSALLKGVKTGSSRFESLSDAQKFLLVPAETSINPDMLLKIVSENPSDEVKAHAARHLCALQVAGETDVNLVVAQGLVGSEALVDAALEFKVIPKALLLDEKALGQMLTALVRTKSPLAMEVVAELKKIPGGESEIASVISKEVGCLMNLGFQEMHLQRVLFLEQICGPRADIQDALQQVSSFAIAGTLSQAHVELLAPKSCLVNQLKQLGDKAYAFKAAMDLYKIAPTNSLKLCMEGMALDAKPSVAREMISSALREGLEEVNAEKLKLVLSVTLAVVGENQSEEMVDLFTKMMAILSMVNPSVIESTIDEKLTSESDNDDAITSLSLMQMSFGALQMKKGSGDSIEKMKEKISQGMRLKAVKQNSQDFEKEFLSELNGFSDSEMIGLVSDLTQMHDEIPGKAWARKYLGLVRENVLKRTQSASLGMLRMMLDSTLAEYTLPANALPDHKMVTYTKNLQLALRQRR